MDTILNVGSKAGGLRRGSRRIWSEEEKRRIVAETREPGSSVSVVARRHDLNANLLFTWRRTIGATSGADGDAMRLVPAVNGRGNPFRGCLQHRERRPAGSSALAGGDRVIVDATVGAAALRRVIEVLSRR